MLLILSVCLGLGAAAPQLTSEDYYQEYEYYEYVVDDALPRKSDPAFIEVQEINQEQLDKTPIFIGETTVKKKVPLVCVSCRSQGITRRPQQPIDNIIKGTQDEFGEDGRDKVKATPQNTRRAQVPLNHALKSAQDALGEDGRDQVAIQPTRQLTKVQSKGRVGLSGNLKSAQDSFGQDGRDKFASIPKRGLIKAPSRKRVGISGGLRSAQSSLNNDGREKVQSQPRRGLTKIDPRRRLSAIEAVRASQQGAKPTEGKVQVTSKLTAQ